MMNTVEKYNGLDCKGLMFSLFCGLIGGAIPTLFSIISIAVNSINLHWISFIALSAFTIFLLQSKYPMRSVIKCCSSILGYIICFLVAFKINFAERFFALLNSEYVAEGGELNSGSGLGFITVFFPLSLVMLISSVILSIAVTAIRNHIQKNKKTGENYDKN